MVTLLVAWARNQVIGRDNDLPWYLPADLKRFRQLTTGHSVIMGRKTFDSIMQRLGRPLTNRTNIILTRDKGYQASGSLVAGSLSEALQLVPSGQQTFVIGGAKVFRQALPIADRLHVTEIDAEIEGDVRFPEFDRSRWREVERTEHGPDDKNAYHYAFITYERKS